MIKSSQSILIHFLFLLFCSFNANSATPKEPKKEPKKESKKETQKEARIYVEAVYHRPATDLVKLIKPFIDQPSVLKSVDSNLIIKANYKNYLLIKQLIRQFDQPLKKLKISISASPNRFDQTSSNVKNIILTINSNSKRNKDKIRTIIATEGYPAFINTSRSFPVLTQSTNANGTTSSTKYKHLNSGFNVITKIHGDTATLVIYAQTQALSRAGGGHFNSQQSHTKITIPLDQWTRIAGGNDTPNRSQSSLIISTKNRNQASDSLYIKVKLLP